MGRKLLFVLSLAVAAVVFAAPVALAGHKPGHHYPPGCTRPPASSSPGCQKHTGASSSTLERLRALRTRFTAEPESGITIGWLTVAGVGTFSVLYAVRRRRRLQALRG